MNKILIQDSSKISGADLLVETLQELGVEVVFCITGAGNLALVDSLVRENRIKIIYSHHEQAAVMEAQGYSRVTGRLGVALVTTGGGTSNVLTGVLSAHLDSIPVLVISGNESSFHCDNPYQLRAYGVQGFDSVSVLKPVTKSSVRVNGVEQVRKIVLENVELALEDRKGPVHIDFPMDLQRKSVDKDQIIEETIFKVRSLNVTPATKDFVNDLVAALSKSNKPLLYIGNGCRNERTLSLLRKLITELQIPYILSWSAIDTFPNDDELNVGRVGIYGDRAANILLQQVDVLLALGTRLAIPQMGYDRKDFARNASKWIVEIDETECSKFEGLGWQVLNEDVQTVLSEILVTVGTNFDETERYSSWRKDVRSTWKELPRIKQIGNSDYGTSFIHSAEAISTIFGRIDADATIVTDVGAALLNGHYIFEARGAQRLFTSQGLGEMGFGLPGAIGAYFGSPEKQIVCLNTDGAIMFNLQELQLVKEHKIPLKLFIFNNSGYSMIKISQENLFDSRFSGSSTDSGISFPEFADIAKTFGFSYARINNAAELDVALSELLSPDAPVLFEVVMHPDQKYLPRLATTKLSDGTLVSPPIEDMDPPLDYEVLESLMKGDLHPNSRLSRELRNG